MPFQHSSSYSSSGSVQLKDVRRSSMAISYGGFDNGMSRSSTLVEPSHDFIFDNEKMVMQALNTRLASYLDKVRSLEAANRKTELQIKEWYESRGTVASKDHTQHYSIIEDLRRQINKRVKENAALRLQMANTITSAMDYKTKFEAEMNMCLAVEADLANLRGHLETIQSSCKDLELQIPELKEELILLKNNHEEEMNLLRAEQSGSVNVQVDCADSASLDVELQAIRSQYETLIKKYHSEAEIWFKSKMTEWKSQVTSSTAEVSTSQAVITDLKKTWQQLQIELDSLHMQKQVLEKSMAEMNIRYSDQLSQLQLHINYLQGELEVLKASMQQQCMEYQMLLDVKMRLELEIAEYRRLLGGEDGGTVVNKSIVEKTVTKTVEIKEQVEVKKEEEAEEQAHVQRRVKVIVENLVDGKVVSVEVNEKLEEVEEVSSAKQKTAVCSRQPMISH